VDNPEGAAPDPVILLSMVSRRALEVLQALTEAPFLREAAVTSGVPPATLDELAAAGRIVQPLRGVWMRAGPPGSLRLRADAARLILPAGAALCRGTAAWLMGIDARAPGAHLADPVLECAVPRGRTPLRRAGVRCYVTDLVAQDVTEVAGLPCTTPERTAIDLARWSMPGMGLSVLDAMARAGLIVPAELLALTERWAGDRFIAQARRLVSLCDPAAESYGESWLRLRFCDAGFPLPDLQISLTDGTGSEVRRLDLGYRAMRHAWEYDGEEFHAGHAAEAADRRRRAEIERRWGWTVVGVGKNLVLGPSMALEYGIGEVVGMRPLIRRRLW
jgi:hypothetical protein